MPEILISLWTILFLATKDMVLEEGILVAETVVFREAEGEIKEILTEAHEDEILEAE